jgi:hypothetical protein
MFFTENPFRKIENDKNRSIDYYNNVCNSDGGTSLVVTEPIQLERSTEETYNQKSIKFTNITIQYKYEDLYDFDDESEKATKELENDPEIMKMIEIGHKEILENKKTSWKSIRNS